MNGGPVVRWISKGSANERRHRIELAVLSDAQAVESAWLPRPQSPLLHVDEMSLGPLPDLLVNTLVVNANRVSYTPGGHE